MFAIIMVVLAIALSWAVAAQRSDVEDVTANDKPGDDDTEPSNDLALSRDMGRAREMVHDDDRVKLTRAAEPEPKQDHPHIQYLDQPFICLMLERAEKERAEKERRSKGILWQLFGTVEHSHHRDIDRKPRPIDLPKSRGRHERELER
jgi:hypothetical protein